MIRNLAFAHRSQHVQQGRFHTEDEVRAFSSALWEDTMGAPAPDARVWSCGAHY
jgi:hypothetical protein